jgi:hypothetical protein
MMLIPGDRISIPGIAYGGMMLQVGLRPHLQHHP